MCRSSDQEFRLQWKIRNVLHCVHADEEIALGLGLDFLSNFFLMFRSPSYR